jgi:hypothetical protein
MKDVSTMSVRARRGSLLLLALALLLAVLFGAAQAVWADHASGHIEYLDFVSQGQRAATSISTWSLAALDCSVPDFSALTDGARLESVCEHRSNLIQLYRDGLLQYHAPGR